MVRPTPLTFAAHRFDVILEIRAPVIDRDLCSRWNILFRPHPHPFAGDKSFRVRSARMIDVPRRIAARAAVNRPLWVDFKKVFAAPLLDLGGGNQWAGVLDEAFTGWERHDGE